VTHSKVCKHRRDSSTFDAYLRRKVYEDSVATGAPLPRLRK
jgi:hypothetical protein